MQDECLNSHYVYEEPLPVSRLVTATAESKTFKPNHFHGRWQLIPTPPPPHPP